MMLYTEELRKALLWTRTKSSLLKGNGENSDKELIHFMKHGIL